MIDSADPRFARAIALADSSASWPKLRDRDGRCKAVCVPSSKPGRYYVVTRTSCECPDQQRHPGLVCKHRLALEIVLARRQSQPLPASALLEGLQQMLEHRGLERILSTRPPVYAANFRED